MAGDTQSSKDRGTRIVAELTLPGALVIWALRRHYEYSQEQRFWDTREPNSEAAGTRSQAQLECLAGTFSKVFGNAESVNAIETFGQLMLSLEKGVRCQLQINAYDEGSLSVHEEHLLSILAAFQQAEIERAAMLVQWLIASGFNLAFTRHARNFAALLLEAGHSLNGEIKCSLSEGLPDSDGRRPAAACRAESVEDLTLGEAIILQGVRRWVSCLHQEQEPLPVLQAHFTHYGISNSAAALNAVLRNIAFAATRMVDVRGLACPSLSPDEADLLHALAGYQREESAPAYEALLNWLPPSAIRLSTEPLSILANNLRSAGLILPIRKRPDAEEARGLHPRSWHFNGAVPQGKTFH